MEAQAERESKIVFEVDHVIDATCELSFENDLCMSADDNSTLSYVVGQFQDHC